MNIIISRVQRSEVVTQYNLAYRFFNVLLMVVVIVLNPFWSAFTEAYAKRDYNWMRSVRKKIGIIGSLIYTIVGNNDFNIKFFL